MNTYEAFIILKPILDVDNSDNVLKVVEEAVEQNGGKILKKEKQGRKRLAYEIKKFKDGFITVYQMTLAPDAVKRLTRAMQLNEDVLRFMVIARTPAEIVQLNTIPTREREHQRPEREFRPRRERD